MSKKQFEEAEQAWEADSDVEGIQELSDLELKTTVTKILRALMEKVDNMQEQARNVSGEMDMLRKQSKGNTNQHTVLEMRNSFDGLININIILILIALH